jgi:hypothetical protein
MSRISFGANGGRWPIQNDTLTVSVRAQEDGEFATENTLSFGVPPSFATHPDCVAAALATLCGRKYQEIGFDFAISETAGQLIADAYGVSVRSTEAPIPARTPGTRLALNFSGGFDSLAALALAGPDHVQLISMDFGGAFNREANYFRQFDTTLVATDLRTKQFNRNDWRFMGAGSLLLADHLGLGTIGFGTILEATPWNLRAAVAGRPPAPDGPFAAAGVLSTSWIRGLTEIGTAMVILRYMPDQIAPSQRSLAQPKTEKYSRKQLLVHIAAETAGVDVPNVGQLLPPSKKTRFGSSFAVDFLSIFMAQYFGGDLIELLMEEFPDSDLTREVVASDLGFYLKYNPNFLAHIPDQIRGSVLARMHDAGLEPYQEQDFISYARVRKLLAGYHHIPD